ncbi:sugar dehydrogenase complex small subunit [Azorhizobium oxalatiphilum]|nr:sugar dehydrogenase complex small subunit [Azorhizobium oxalatiphilum]
MKLPVSRRRLLIGSAAMAVGYVALSTSPAFPAAPAAAASGEALNAKFMRLSNLLINHRLSPAVGARIAEGAAADHKDMAAMMDQIIAIAEQKQARVVEDFFEDIPAGPAKEFAHWVIFAWYSGVSSPKPDAKVFTFEEALTFQTTSDVVTIPSYGLSGPNLWSQATVPLSQMPRF